MEEVASETAANLCNKLDDMMDNVIDIYSKCFEKLLSKGHIYDAIDTLMTD